MITGMIWTDFWCVWYGSVCVSSLRGRGRRGQGDRRSAPRPLFVGKERSLKARSVLTMTSWPSSNRGSKIGNGCVRETGAFVTSSRPTLVGKRD